MDEDGVPNSSDPLIANQDTRHLAAEIKHRKKLKSKKSIHRSGPLQFDITVAEKKSSQQLNRWKTFLTGKLSEADQEKAVKAALEHYSRLPKSSSYAQHRIKILQQTLGLLNTTERSQEETDQLEELLSKLQV